MACCGRREEEAGGCRGKLPRGGGTPPGLGCVGETLQPLYPAEGQEEAGEGQGEAGEGQEKAGEGSRGAGEVSSQAGRKCRVGAGAEGGVKQRMCLEEVQDCSRVGLHISCPTFSFHFFEPYVCCGCS